MHLPHQASAHPPPSSLLPCASTDGMAFSQRPGTTSSSSACRMRTRAKASASSASGRKLQASPCSMRRSTQSPTASSRAAPEKKEVGGGRSGRGEDQVAGEGEGKKRRCRRCQELATDGVWPSQVKCWETHGNTRVVRGLQEISVFVFLNLLLKVLPQKRAQREAVHSQPHAEAPCEKERFNGLGFCKWIRISSKVFRSISLGTPPTFPNIFNIGITFFHVVTDVPSRRPNRSLKQRT